MLHKPVPGEPIMTLEQILPDYAAGFHWPLGGRTRLLGIVVADDGKKAKIAINRVQAAILKGLDIPPELRPTMLLPVEKEVIEIEKERADWEASYRKLRHAIVDHMTAGQNAIGGANIKDDRALWAILDRA